MDTMAYIAFGFYTILCLGGALWAVTIPSLVRAFAGLVTSLFGVAGLYFLLAAPFIGLMQILIYVGAVAVLIFFAIVITGASRAARDRSITTKKKRCLAVLAGLVPTSFLAMAIIKYSVTTSQIPTQVSMEDLGGAYVHTQHSGGCDHFVRSQAEGIQKLRDIIEFEPSQKLYTERRKTVEPKFDFKEMMRNNPVNTYHGIDIKETIKCLADDSYFHEYKPTYGPGRGTSIIAGKMWLKGIPVGVIASSGNGVIYIDAARKAIEWMIRCGNSNLPVLFLQGSPGYMIGKDEEWNGIGKYGSDMVRTTSVLNVPKLQYVIGPDHGAANYGMCGRAFKPVFCFTNMRGRTTVMSGETAGFIVESVRRKNIVAKGEEVNEDEMAAFRQMMRDRYDAEGHPFLTGSLLFHDGVVAFSESRDKLARALELSLRVSPQRTDWGDLKV